MLVRIANREDLDQSDLGLPCLSRPFFGSKFLNICHNKSQLNVWVYIEGILVPYQLSFR